MCLQIESLYRLFTFFFTSDIKILRGLDKEIDDEIVRVIKSLPDFTPGKKRNKPANVRYTVPINVLDT